MALNHLHLHVRDLARSRAFYERWFGFREHAQHGEILFLRDEQDFDLALVPDAEAPGAFPAWFHFGFRLGDGQAVKDLRAACEAAEVDLRGELHAYDDLVSFRLADPDGHLIEVYWE